MRAVPRRPLLFAGAALLLLGAAEGLARAGIALPARPAMTERAYPFDLLVPDGRGGLSMPAGLRLPAERFSTNSLGLRDPERGDGPSFRVAVLGDDAAVGRGVADDEVWTVLLERALRELDPLSAPVELWNLGLPGAGVEDALRRFEALSDRVRPDLVVLAHHLADDPVDDLLGSAHLVAWDGDVAAAPWRPGADSEYAAERARALRPTLEYGMPWDETLLRRSALFRAASRGVASRVFGRASQVPWGVEPFDFQLFGGYAWLWLDPEPEPLETAWSITDHLLTRVRDAAQDLGAETLVVAVPARFDVDPAARERALAEGWTGRRSEDGAADDATRLVPGTPVRRLAGFCAAHEIELLDLTPGLSLAGEARPRYYEDLPTWNADGHRAAARLLGRALLERRLVPASGRDPAALDSLLADPEARAPSRFDGGFRPDRRRPRDRVRWEAVHERPW